MSLAAVPAAPAFAQIGAKNPITVSHIGVGATATEMSFSWRTTYRGEEYVKFHPRGGVKEERREAAKEADFGAIAYRTNHATITGLKPDTEYTYQIGSNEGGWSEPASFRTQGAGSSWKFVALSDAELGVGLRVKEQAEAWRTAVNQATAKAPDAQFILHAGDQIATGGDPISRWAAFFSPEQLRSYPLALAKGEQESRLTVERHFKEHVNFPNQEDGSANYYFERNNALFIVLDSTQNDAAAIARHARFVRQTAAAHGAGKDWIIAVMHHSPYTHGEFGIKSPEAKRLREGLAPAFSEAGVNLVMGGHEHMYNRSRLMNGTEPVGTDTPAKSGDVLRPKDGEVLYLTTTTAGGGRYGDVYETSGAKRTDITDSSQMEGSEFANPAIGVWQQDRTPDYTVVDVKKNTLTVRTFNVADDSLVDEFTLDRSTTNPNVPDVTPGEGSSAEGSSGEGSSAGKIVGIVIGVLAGLLGILALLSPLLRDLAERNGIRL